MLIQIELNDHCSKTGQEDMATEASHDYFWATSGRLSGERVTGVKEVI